MNVVIRDLPTKRRTALKKKPIGLIRKNTATSRDVLGHFTQSFKAALPLSKNPRYQFGNCPATAKFKNSPMGPPIAPPKTFKKRTATQSGPSWSTDFSSGARVLANETTLDTSKGMHTPANRPTALRYISSSSKGRTHPHSSRSTATSVVEASVILAITEGRGMARGEIGLAAVDLRRPHLVVCQFSDSLLYTHTLTKINYFNPVEIIVPNTFCECAVPTQLYRLIRDQYPGVTLTSVQRRHFNSEAGKQQVVSLCAPAYSGVYMQLLHKFYALTAAAALLKYVESIQCIVFARESLKVEYHCSENTMIVDVGTATQLELVVPLEQSAGPSCCLLGVLGPTYTAGGIRALRAAILQPSSNRRVIEDRLDCVQEFIENDEGLMSGVQDVIKKLTEVEKILFLCIESPKQEMNKMSEAQLNQTLLLKSTMELVPRLMEALAVAQSGRLRKIKMDFENPHYKEIGDRIRKVIQDDAHMEKGCLGNLQRCFAVKPDINGLLDVARRTYSELIDDIQKIVENLSESYDLPIRLNQNALKGFHIVLPLAMKDRRNFNAEDLPSIFIQVQNNGASVSMTTEELVVLDQQAKESLSEIHSMSNIVIYGLLKDLRPFMGSLYKLCENIAELDIILALAHASSVGSYVRPQFNEYLEIRNSVHPLLDYNSQKQPVANDISASPEYNFTIITGPNMGGKSIYIKQIAVLHVMAQIGCFVPATNAVMRLTDHIFSRIGFNDSVELNASTYVLEMKEIQHMLKGLTPTSLVIIDELCRGTSSEEGGTMAWAISEELMLRPAFTFFTTHFLYLTRLQSLYLNVTNLRTLVSEELKPNSDEKRLIYHHRVEPGVTALQHYGLALAKTTNLPEMTIKLAEELAEVIAQNKKPLVQENPERTDEILIYKLNADIKKERRKSSNSEAVVKKLLDLFRKENPALIERLKAAEDNKTENSATSAPVSTKSSISIENNNDENKHVSSKANTTSSNDNIQRTDSVDPEEITIDNNIIHNNSDLIEDQIKIMSVETQDSTVRNTTQLVNTIPDDKSYDRNDSDNVMVVDQVEENIYSSGDSALRLDEDCLRTIDEIESDHSILQGQMQIKNKFILEHGKSHTATNDHLMQNSLSKDIMSRYDVNLASQLDFDSPRKDYMPLSSSRKPELDQDLTEADLASLSTVFIGDRSRECLYRSSSSVESMDETLFMETVAEIHNEMKSVEEMELVDGIESVEEMEPVDKIGTIDEMEPVDKIGPIDETEPVDATDPVDETGLVESVLSCILPPPPEFAD